MALELAHRLASIGEQKDGPAADTSAEIDESRGKVMGKVPIHSVRLPGYVISIESLFGMEDKKLSIQHDAGSGASPYVKGALMAIDKVNTFKGLRRGLDSVVDFYQNT